MSRQEISRTTANDEHFRELVSKLDAELADRDGDEHDFYHQYNGLEQIIHAIVATRDGRPVACGALKEFAAGTMEVKRMYTLPEHRGEGLAATVLAELEQWAHEDGYHTCILETGVRQPEAIALYRKSGYEQIPNYGQYEGVTNSVCFKKAL